MGFVTLAVPDEEITVNPGDIQIGAVEIKDGTTDTRAKVAASTAISEAHNALATHDPSLGKSTDAAIVADENGSAISFLRGLVKILSSSGLLLSQTFTLPANSNDAEAVNFNFDCGALGKQCRILLYCLTDEVGVQPIIQTLRVVESNEEQVGQVSLSIMGIGEHKTFDSGFFNRVSLALTPDGSPTFDMLFAILIFEFSDRTKDAGPAWSRKQKLLGADGQTGFAITGAPPQGYIAVIDDLLITSDADAIAAILQAEGADSVTKFQVKADTLSQITLRNQIITGVSNNGDAGVGAVWIQTDGPAVLNGHCGYHFEPADSDSVVDF